VRAPSEIVGAALLLCARGGGGLRGVAHRLGEPGTLPKEYAMGPPQE
jgi:hypothetical protein